MPQVTIQDTLPDPSNQYGVSQSDATGPYGPGFSSLVLESNQKIMRQKTNTGRMIQNHASGHQWKIKIGYNPMTRAEFAPVYNFLQLRQASLKPFFVSLPQHTESQNTSFNTWLNTNTVPLKLDAIAGQKYFILKSMSTDSTIGPEPGDLFSITNSDSLHTKVYQVTAVETNDNYGSSGQPATSERLIHFHPPLVRPVDTDDTLKFKDVQIRVIHSKDLISYSLGVDNLYKFSLEVEEAQP